MSIHFEPLQKEDYEAIGPIVRDGFSENSPLLPATVDSRTIFGRGSAEGDERSVSTDHGRGYIVLCKPVLNMLFAGNSANKLCHILGIDASIGAEVCMLSLCMDAQTHELVPASDAETPEGFLWGAEIFQYWIEQFEAEAAARAVLTDAVAEFSKENSLSGKGVLVRGGNQGTVAAGKWRFVPEETGEDYSQLPYYIGRNYMKSQSARLPYLLNLDGHEERLRIMVQKYVMVVPMGMRPSIAGRHDPLTCLYNEIITANKNLSMALSGRMSSKEFVQKYKALSDSVYHMQVAPSRLNPRRKPMLGSLATKEGLIRGKMLSRRIDYSGRSVITINPFLSLRDVQIPEEMAPKLYRSHILETMLSPNPADWIGPDKKQKCLDRLKEKHILDDVYAVIGRQPTLHKPSMRAFHVELTKERSIGINPLCVTGFNADFDGDQMWVRVPVGEKATEDVRQLMTLEQNPYFPKNGECAFMPRQEIIYGLNICTRKTLVKGSSKRTYPNLNALLDDLFGQRMKVSDTVTLDGYTDCAGKVAFAACLPKHVFAAFGVEEITTKNIGKYVEAALKESVEQAIDCVDLLVRLGFKIAYLHPPTLNLLGDDITDYSTEVAKFHDSIAEVTSYYERGMEEEAKFDADYDAAFMQLESDVKDAVFERSGLESGFVRLAASGARGSKSNLVQMYAYKGRIQKSARESFRVVVEHSYAEQLLPLEHFLSAYGGRDGLITKSLNSADTGYAFRQMWHAASPFMIVSNDCGTKEGLTISKADIAQFFQSKDDINDIFKKIITGRYEAGTDRYITEEVAEEMCSKRDAVTIRSILSCKNPCCKKCYGDDPSTHRPAAMALPIGLIAAQSIGETGTQLSMDSFKKGGIATDKGITTSFAKLKEYISCAHMEKRANYDPVAWASGPVKKTFLPNGSMRVQIGDVRKSINLPAKALIKSVAEKGKGLCTQTGDYDINELLEYTDLRTAQTYLLHTLYSIYRDECEITMKHFEVLVASMTMHLIISSPREDLVVGQYHDSVQLYSGPLDGTIYTSTLVDVNAVPQLRPQALSRVLLESVKQGLYSDVLLGLEDPVEYPLSQIMMGQELVREGSERFIEERRLSNGLD